MSGGTWKETPQDIFGPKRGHSTADLVAPVKADMMYNTLNL